MLSGMYLGGTRADIGAAEQWLGSKVDMNVTFYEYKDWAGFKWAAGAAPTAAKAQSATPLMSIPLAMTTGGTLKAAAEHAYDSYYVDAAKKLVAALGTEEKIHIRLGNEFNETYFPWSAIKDPASFAQAYRNAVDAFRSVSGNFVFEWNIATGKTLMDPAKAYPGDAYVDYIGGDFYMNKANATTADANKIFQYLAETKYGLKWIEDFATAHGKQTAFSEWGMNSANGGPFIALAKQWFETHNVAYANYWESNAAFKGLLEGGQHGAAGELYKALFGTGVDPAGVNIAKSWTGDGANNYFGQEATNINYTVNGGNGHDTIALGHGNNVVSGGTGNDNLYVGNGNNIIYGNAAGAKTDSADTIMAGGGDNKIYAQLGNDKVTVGITDSKGNNMVDGGDGNDVIIVKGAGTNTLLGGAGTDKIDVSAARGDNLLNGGLGNDTLIGGAGHDTLLGDAGDDRLVAGKGVDHVDVMTGGAGADIFDFSALGSASVAHSGTNPSYQEITDFQVGVDDIDLSFALKAGDLLTVVQQFATVSAAQAQAQSLLDAHAGTTDVAALRVGADTFLFYHDGGTAGAIDSIVKLDGVSNSALGLQDFV